MDRPPQLRDSPNATRTPFQQIFQSLVIQALLHHQISSGSTPISPDFAAIRAFSQSKYNVWYWFLLPSVVINDVPDEKTGSAVSRSSLTVFVWICASMDAREASTDDVLELEAVMMISLNGFLIEKSGWLFRDVDGFACRQQLRNPPFLLCGSNFKRPPRRNLKSILRSYDFNVFHLKYEKEGTDPQPDLLRSHLLKLVLAQDICVHHAHHDMRLEALCDSAEMLPLLSRHGQAVHVGTTIYHM
ncbi:hypothetical protein DFJ58DRAFT_838650 [Suillus subalutaceus]|uniref:uncharacterized protein n=1 Tax=Suillus subalutaceus TaxID=48586 RepID=UPI001B872BB3|nr:uncharacterized protein DFJ58DRAFT_838650 [Suillus subalutaceus]KAG1865543.1 hypothetical protein DFJ58DRAFT_838650 [Suillus subalutaceus]